MNKSQMWAVQWGIGRCVTMGFGVNFRWFGVGRFEPESPRCFNRPQNDLQHMQRAAGLKPVAMRRYPAHGMDGYGSPDHFIILMPTEIGPFAGQANVLIECDMRQFS